MTVLLLTLAVFIVAVAAMAMGVMFTGRRLQGSCGGVAGASCLCTREGTAPGECPRKQSNESRTSAAHGRRSLDVLPD